MATNSTSKPDTQPTELASNESTPEKPMNEKRSYDATVNVNNADVYSKFKWGNANDFSSSGKQLYFHITGYEDPLVLEFDDEIILGRLDADENQFPVVDLTPYGGAEKGVSRNHAVIQRMRNNIVLMDLGSSNKSYINGQRIASYQSHILVEGDEIRLGNLVATISYRNDSQTTLSKPPAS